MEIMVVKPAVEVEVGADVTAAMEEKGEAINGEGEVWWRDWLSS
jgi:hypothetical protein